MAPHIHNEDQGFMLSVEEALHKILKNFSILDSVESPVIDALGLTLDEDIHANFDIPPLPNSAMDGYAVRYDDVAYATLERSKLLRVIDQIPAGSLPNQHIIGGTAARIMTGAPIPTGADTVIPFEQTDEVERAEAGKSLDFINIRFHGPQGNHVRPQGEDIRKGQLVLHKGTTLRPPHIGVLGSLGFPTIRVIRQPRVGILATGDELVFPGKPLPAGKIYDSNSFSLAASVRRYGGIPELLGIAADNVADTERKLLKGIHCDLLVTSAGVSKGAFDLVKDVLAKRGEIQFWSIRMRPAKPLAFGILRHPDGGTTPHIGLPGNPVSSLVAFEQFCRPAILCMLGKTTYRKPTVQATLKEPIDNPDGRRVYARVWVEHSGSEYTATAVGPDGSNLLTSMVRANGLAICPENIKRCEAGETVEVQMLNWDEEIEI
jgi:molybdopterin molybdotransferase